MFSRSCRALCMSEANVRCSHRKSSFPCAIWLYSALSISCTYEEMAYSISSFWDGMVEWAYTLHFWWKKQYADSMLSLQYICLQYLDVLAGAVATLRLYRLDFLHHVQSFRHLAEYRVLSVQVWSAADGRVCLHLLLA